MRLKFFPKKLDHYTAYVDIFEDGEVGFGSTEYIVIREKEGLSDKRFLFYLAISPRFREVAIKCMTGTSGRQRVQTDVLVSKPFLLPLLPEQKSIANILSSFDEKIELLREQNKTLETLAQTIFKEWFVNFNYPGATGERVDSELGEIPKGWRVECIYDLAEYVNGAAYKNMHFSSFSKGHPVIKIVELKSGISHQTKFTETDLGEKYKIDNDDILFSWSGSPETSIDIFIWTLGKAYLNQHIFKVVPRSGLGKCYVYNVLKYFKPTFVLIAKMKQTTGLGHVTIGDLKKMLFVMPDKAVLNLYNDAIKPIYEKQFQLKIQVQTLSKTRDILLPKLMSGQVRIGEAQCLN
ncbi:MAG: restriction endonuclease subunit S [Thiohalomonadales bacterium]